MAELQIVRVPELLPYLDGLALQQHLRREVAAGRSSGAVVLCEHPSVYTAGRRTQPSDLPSDGSPVVDVDRGGRITWHGPGQLVAYPIVRLSDPLDVVAWVRDLEQVLIDVAASVGVRAERVDGRSGAWVRHPDGTTAKVAAIGLHVAEGISSHGIAINCTNDLAPYDAIVPCGISDAGVTTLSHEAGRTIDVADIADTVATRIVAAVDGMRSGHRIAQATTSLRTDAPTPAHAPVAAGVSA
ncbi:lipoyl(octanoyl) transferase LipB [Curtobacterium ammoniigenes]|uniref:lipoyl(octanoyl) transferase LipB n=1 Tax=Curtobacterium ammoniigenes TaxID=395387 RepID=UPI00082A3AA6|nr:lipoyl(octanoyl) transferase LipB [Curtobacterium ammoniigenes]